MPVQKSIGQSFIELQTVDSTNNYATALLHEGMAQHGTVVFSHHQSKGRGQRNNAWLTGTNENIAMSIVIQPVGLALSQLFLLSMSFAVGVQNFFNRYTLDRTKIKWPNDLYWCDRKAGGILIENSLTADRWNHAIVGIGININQTGFEDLNHKAVSLKQITGHTYDILEVAKELCVDLQWAYSSLLIDPQTIINSYQQNLYKLNEVVRLKEGTKVFNTRIKSVTTTGQLITQHVIEESFEVGEIEWIIN